MEKLAYTRFTFQDCTGYLLNPGNARHGCLTICHSASVPPWNDMDVHLHQESWEYYVVLEGSKTLQIEGQEETFALGEMHEISPGVRHVLLGRVVPYVGYAFRVPLRNDKVEF